MHHEIELPVEQRAECIRGILRAHAVRGEQLAAVPVENACAGGEHQIVDGKIGVEHALGRVQGATGGDHAQAAGLSETLEGAPVRGPEARLRVEQRAVEIGDDHGHAGALSAPWRPRG